MRKFFVDKVFENSGSGEETEVIRRQNIIFMGVDAHKEVRQTLLANEVNYSGEIHEAG